MKKTGIIEVNGYTLIPCTYNGIPYYTIYSVVDNTEVFGTLIEESNYQLAENVGIKLPLGLKPSYRSHPMYPINIIGTDEVELEGGNAYFPTHLHITDYSDPAPNEINKGYFKVGNVQDIWNAIEKIKQKEKNNEFDT